MTETKLSANLPNLTIEVVARELPEQRAETMTIVLKATPSFDAIGQLLTGGPFNLLAANPWLNAWMLWGKLAQTALAPMTMMMQPQLIPVRRPPARR